MESTQSDVRRLLQKDAAAEYKAHTEELIAAMRAEADSRTGKEHHEERTAKGKAICELRSQGRYIDACRVVQGLEPIHGFFAGDLAGQAAKRKSPKAARDVKGSVMAAGGAAGAVHIDAEEAARLAAEAEAALKKLEEEQGQRTEQGDAAHLLDGPVRPEVADELLLGWRRRATRLEAKLSEPAEAPPKIAWDVDELERIAQEVVDYRTTLRRQYGYRKKDLKEDRDLVLIEARLDTLAGAYLPEEEQPELPTVDEEAEELRQWERRLIAKLAQRTQSTPGAGPSTVKELEKLMSEIVELKAKLRAQGLTEHEQDKDEEVMRRLLRVQELRQFQHRDKKHEKKDHRDLQDIRVEVGQLRSKIDDHKRRLRDEKGLSQKGLRTDPEVCELEERLLMLQRMGGA